MSPRLQDGNTEGGLLNGVVAVSKERNTLRNVKCSCWATVVIPVRREKTLWWILWPLWTILVSNPLPKTICAFSSWQVAHGCIVSCIRQGKCHKYYIMSPEDSLLRYYKLIKQKSFIHLLPESFRGQNAHCSLQATPDRQQHSVYVVLRSWTGSAHTLSPSSLRQQISTCTSWSASIISEKENEVSIKGLRKKNYDLKQCWQKLTFKIYILILQ